MICDMTYFMIYLIGVAYLHRDLNEEKDGGEFFFYPDNSDQNLHTFKAKVSCCVLFLSILFEILRDFERHIYSVLLLDFLSWISQFYHLVV